MSETASDINQPLQMEIDTIIDQLKEHFNLDFSEEMPKNYSNYFLNNINWLQATKSIYKYSKI